MKGGLRYSSGGVEDVAYQVWGPRSFGWISREKAVGVDGAQSCRNQHEEGDIVGLDFCGLSSGSFDVQVRSGVFVGRDIIEDMLSRFHVKFHRGWTSNVLL